MPLLRAFLRVVGTTVLAATLAGTAPTALGARESGVNHFDAAAIVAQLADGLAQGRQATVDHLRRLGLGEVIDEPGASRRDQVAISSRALLESLYRRAEASKRGEGRRFLAILYVDVASRSAALASDPAFKPFKGYKAAQLDLRVQPIRFVPRSSLLSPAPPLSLAAARAVEKLAQVYAGTGLASARAVLLRHLRKDNFGPAEFERVVLESGSVREALEQVVVRGTPPPTPELALRGVFIDVMGASAALTLDKAMWAVIERLSALLPPEHIAYVKNEGRLPSRQRQARATGENDPQSHGKGAFSPNAEDLRAAKQSFDEWRYSPNIESRFAEAVVQAHERSSRPSPKAPSYKPPLRPRPRKGFLMGNEIASEVTDAPLVAWWVPNLRDDRFGRLFVVLENAQGAGKHRLAASKVMFADSFYAAVSLATTWESGAEALKRGMTTLLTIDRESVRLLALDGALSRPDKEIAKWTGIDLNAPLLQPQVLSRQRELLAKSLKSPTFRSQRATDRSFGLGAGYKHGDETFLFRNTLNSPGFVDLSDSRARHPDATFGLAKDGNEALLIGYGLTNSRWLDLAGSRSRHPDATLGLVVHPALVGREVAWSLARADFWPLQTPAFLEEAMLTQRPPGLPGLPPLVTLDEAAGWTFFDRPAVVALSPDRLAWRLNVRTGPTGGVASTADARAPQHTGRFGSQVLTRVRVENTVAEASSPRHNRSSNTEAGMNVWMEWMAHHHHDFMRIEDLSNSLVLVRWLRSFGMAVNALDVDGPGRALPVPRYYRWTTGPDVAQ